MYWGITVGAFVGASWDGSKLRICECEKEVERTLAREANITDHSQLVQPMDSMLDCLLVQVKLDWQ